jgi:ribonuclease P protein subunit RPR2
MSPSASIVIQPIGVPGMRRRGRKGRRTREMIEIAKERMQILTDLAVVNMRDRDVEKANRYIDLARRIGMRYNVRFSKGQKRLLCRMCKGILIPDITSKVRLRRGKVNVRCSRCGHVIRYGLRARKQKKSDD